MSSTRAGNDRGRAARRQKAAMLTVLLTTLAAIWGKNLLPEAARGTSAAALPVESSEAAGTAVETATAGAPVPVRLDRPTALGRDPFAIDTSAYEHRPVAAEPELPVPEPDLPSFGAEELGALRLQGTMLGDVPSATINGRTLKIGDTIHGFTIRAIGMRHVVLERDGVAATLGMRDR